MSKSQKSRGFNEEKKKKKKKNTKSTDDEFHLNFLGENAGIGQLSFAKIESKMGEWRERKQRGIRESGFPRQAFNLNGKLNLDPRAFSFLLLFSSRGDQQHESSRDRRQTDETFQGEKEGRKEEKNNRDNQRRGRSSFKFSALFTFKNGSFMMNTFPGYPTAKIFNLLINVFKLKRKPETEKKTEKIWESKNGSLRRRRRRNDRVSKTSKTLYRLRCPLHKLYLTRRLKNK